MFKYIQWKKTVSLLMMLSVCPLFVACGDEEGEGTSSTTGSGAGAGLVCFVLILTSGDDECLGYLGSSSSSGGSGSSGSSGSSGGSGGSGGSGTSSSSDDIIALKPIDEYEPNNDWLNANPVEFPKTPDRDGFIIDGSVNDVSDQADEFTFARTFLRFHAFRLCSDGQKYCDKSGEIDTLTAYIDILDQTGRILASSQASDSNFIRLQLAGGVPHYVRVVAADTMATTVKYHLVGHEANY